MSLNLTVSEQERLAYISGNVLLAQILVDFDELQNDMDDTDDRQKESYDDGFADGKKSVLGVKSVKAIADLEHDLKRARDDANNLRKQLYDIADMFNTNEAKTISGRKRT